MTMNLMEDNLKYRLVIFDFDGTLAELDALAVDDDRPSGG